MRIFHKSGSTITEFSDNVKKFSEESKNVTILSGESLYIATDFPFNHLYFNLGTNVNVQPVNLSVDYFSNSDWVPVAYLTDGTVGMSQSGFIEFTPDKDESWNKESTNYGGDLIIELSTIKVYDMYWIRVTFDDDMDDVDFNWIGNLFSNDTDLYSEFPIFADTTFLTAFSSGKLDWKEQHVKASELIIQELKRKNIIIGAEQILDRDVLMPASVSKVAEIIYNAFGRDYNDNRDNARKEYDKRMDLSKFVIDTNENAIKEPYELKSSQGWLCR
jgi:hypothetical protein